MGNAKNLMVVKNIIFHTYDRSGLASLAKISAEEVMAAKREKYEIFLQTVPMTLVQTYILFQMHPRFQLCNIKDCKSLKKVCFSKMNLLETIFFQI